MLVRNRWVVMNVLAYLVSDQNRAERPLMTQKWHKTHPPHLNNRRSLIQRQEKMGIWQRFYGTTDLGTNSPQDPMTAEKSKRTLRLKCSEERIWLGSSIEEMAARCTAEVEEARLRSLNKNHKYFPKETSEKSESATPLAAH